MVPVGLLRRFRRRGRQATGGGGRSRQLGVAVAIAAIRFYQVTFSQFFTGSCRFVPSCSAYAIEAVWRHGALRGGWLAVRRLMRCHPLCAGGLDQVPTAPAPRR